MPTPERWEIYSPLGKVISGTNLIAFKVPLKEALLTTLPQKDWFTPSMLIQQVRDQGINLKLVVDLTFTKKYYSPAEFTSQDIHHKKIFTQGQVVPSNDVYSQFASAVKEFDKDHVIGVHCTHGVNRTGYLICRYMIEELKFDPHEAIRLFNDARGHELERPNYLQDLKCRIPGEATQVSVDIPETGDHPKKRKPRWRHNRDDHIGWRSEKSQAKGGSHQNWQDTGRGESVRETYASGYQGQQHYTRNYYAGNHGEGYHNISGEFRNHEQCFPGRESHAQNYDKKYPNQGYQSQIYDRRYQGGKQRNYDYGYQSQRYESYGRNCNVGYQSMGYNSRNSNSQYQGRGGHSRDRDTRFHGKGYYPQSQSTEFRSENHDARHQSRECPKAGRDTVACLEKR